MSTYETIERNIIANLAREGEEGVTAAVNTHVAQAIRHYENKSWWFMEERHTATSSSSVEYYPIPSNGLKLDSITITVSNNVYPLHRRHYSTLEDWNAKANVFTGYPTDYAEYNDEVRLYPVPNGSYELVFSYKRSTGTTLSGATSNAWTIEGEDLISARAEWSLQARRYKDPEGALLAKSVENDAYQDLWSRNVQRQTTGRNKRRM